MPDEDDQDPADEDKFRPAAIAARIDKLGSETDVERVAREEEQKLQDRKKDRKRSGLEAAASKRLAKIGEGAVKRPSVAAVDAVPEAGPLLERANRAGQWIRKHRTAFGSIVAVAVVGVAGALGWVFWQDKRSAEASVLLAQALADEHGHVNSAKDDDAADDAPIRRLYPNFKSEAEKRAAALEKYRSVEARYPGTGAAILARLAEASLLLDTGDAKGAAAAYGDVGGSALAKADGEVRGRALEGIGFSDELLAENDAAGKDRHLDDALGAFKALEGVGVDGFKELGLYHQARVLIAKGDRAKAIELLKNVHKRVSEDGETHSFSYLEFVVEDRLRELDPTALPPKAPRFGGPGGRPGGAGGGPGGIDMNDPKIQELLRQLQQKGQGGGAPRGPAPGSSP